MYPILANGLGKAADSNAFLDFINIFLKLIPIEDTLVRYCVLFIIIAVLVFLAKLFYLYFYIRLSSRIVIDTKMGIFNKYMRSDYQFFVDNKQGEILYKTYTAPNSISGLLNIISSAFVEIILSISVFILLFSISLKGTVIIIVGGILYYYLTKYLSSRVSYVAGRKKLESSQSETVVISEFTSGIKQIKVFETYGYWREMFDSAVQKFYKYHRKSYFWRRVPEVMLFLVLYLSVGGVVILIKLQYPGEFLSVLPVIGTFAFAVMLVLPKLSKFGNYRMEFMHILPDAEAVYSMLKDITYSTMKNGNKEFIQLKSGIEMKDVNFAHKDRDILLDNISLKIKKDKITALVGPSGSGKSTIVDLLLRLHDVESGGVYIDGVNIKDYDIFSFLKKIGFVSQETFVYNATIRDNIAFGGEYTDNEILEAAKLANADEFIQKTPDKYNTIVGDRGMKLSGGEKQRIAIARAVIRKPEILILDEATSSLDNVSESFVQDAINAVSKNCTTFIIAHRLTTIQNADVINVLDNGKIIESGSHEELVAKKGEYWKLYNIQKQ
jgi:ATP-binding cassette subfamily B protein/subfamily B ATP-binding cassette protein MsbA